MSLRRDHLYNVLEFLFHKMHMFFRFQVFSLYHSNVEFALVVEQAGGNLNIVGIGYV